jgi:hypothetical protein
VSITEVPVLAGVHHLKLPVSDLTRSAEWYQSRLGYRVAAEFGRRPRPGGRAAAGFDYFSIGVPDRDVLDALAARLTGLGEEHAGVHWASIGWILPLLHDPDGHEVRFYTMKHHLLLDPEQVTTFADPRETSEAWERKQAQARA